jgi:lipopolysaccharide/colanic/teichoic acid biosynthesis glycosyltransferase
MKTESIKNVEVESFKLEEIKGYNGIYNKYIKRIFDVLLALLLLIILLPVYLIISLFIIVETGFPVIYKAERGGYNRKNFKIYKFRTMVKNADEIGGGTTALNDPRITKVGNFLRKTKLDEITQIINIIKGEMSFIGPRPELIKYTSQYSGNEEFILMVRPGITDYSSIEFINLDEIVGGDNADEIYEKFVLKKKNQLRIKYAAKVSMKTDLYLFFNTVWRVVQKAIKHIANK